MEEALGLWQGLALADIPGTDRIEVIRTGLASEHLAAASDRIGWLVASGRERVAAELAGLDELVDSHADASGRPWAWSAAPPEWATPHRYRC